MYPNGGGEHDEFETHEQRQDTWSLVSTQAQGQLVITNSLELGIWVLNWVVVV